MDSTFSDLVVLELASVLAGPSVGQFFAELGARVIKVENPSTNGDVTRSWRTAGEDISDRPAYFHSCNWGKESLALNLKSETGRSLLQELVSISDIVLTNFLPDVSRKFGVDYETLKGINPGIILGSIVGYRPDSNRPGYDAIIQAEAGYYFINGQPDTAGQSPTKMPVALMDILAAHQLKQALLLALLKKQKTGDGSEVIVSLIDAAVSSLANQATNWLVAGQIPQPLGSEHPNIAPYGSVFMTADRHAVVLAVGTDRQFDSLCSLLNLTELARDERFLRNADRVENRGELNAELQIPIRLLERDHFLAECLRVSVPAGAVHRMDEVMASVPDHVLLRTQDGTARGVREFVAWPDADADAEAEKTTRLSSPPRYASSTDSILKGTLGLDNNTIDELERREIIVRRPSTRIGPNRRS